MKTENYFEVGFFAVHRTLSVNLRPIHHVYQNLCSKSLQNIHAYAENTNFDIHDGSGKGMLRVVRRFTLHGPVIGGFQCHKKNLFSLIIDKKNRHQNKAEAK